MAENRKLYLKTNDQSEKKNFISTSDSQKRILARRIRVQKRSDLKKKQNASEVVGIVAKTETEKQVDESAGVLEKLITEGAEAITNVRAANDAREVQRREDEIGLRRNLLRRLEKKAENATKKHQDINKQWQPIITSIDPLDIYTAIESLKKGEYTELLEQKNVVIAELKQELENSDTTFKNDNKKQTNEINLLIERIDSQINMISKAYRQELIFIEDALKNERSNILLNFTKEWNSLFEKQLHDEIKGVENRQEIMRKYKNEINFISNENKEQYKYIKIWLETESQNIQTEVQNMKALCFMNIEKLNYSYVILKRRVDENIIVKNQQKKRINKLYESINSCKKIYIDMEHKTHFKINKLKEQIIKAHKNIQDLVAKSENFMFNNDKQFTQIWDMNTKVANDLLEEIWNTDKIVHQKILSLNSTPPEKIMFKKEDLQSYREITQIVERKNLDEFQNIKLNKKNKADSSAEKRHQKRILMNDMTRKISNKANFMVEDKTNTLLFSHGKKDQIIIKLDIIFWALNITCGDQIYLLMDYFLPYTFCRLCEEKTTEPYAFSKSVTLDTNAVYQCQYENLHERTKQLIEKVKILLLSGNENEGENQTQKVDMESTPTALNTLVDSQFVFTNEKTKKFEINTLNCVRGHIPEIQSKNVIKALSKFIENYYEDNQYEKSSDHQDKSTDNNVTLLKSISEKDINEYWKKYKNSFSEKKKKLWDGLMESLHIYYEILKERQKLNCETESLRKQNSELCKLLDTYRKN